MTVKFGETNAVRVMSVPDYRLLPKFGEQSGGHPDEYTFEVTTHEPNEKTHPDEWWKHLKGTLDGTGKEIPEVFWTNPDHTPGDPDFFAGDPDSETGTNRAEENTNG